MRNCTTRRLENDLDLVKADFYRFKRNDDNGNMTLVYNHLSPNAEDYNVVFNPKRDTKCDPFHYEHMEWNLQEKLHRGVSYQTQRDSGSIIPGQWFLVPDIYICQESYDSGKAILYEPQR